jgi:ADP-ribosyl-[dinitrogen reductase] hydrolase
MTQRDSTKALATLEALFARQAIPIQRAPLFDTEPSRLPAGFDFDRVEGMMLGLAIGDSLGLPTEGLEPSRRRHYAGEIRDYNYSHRERHRILPSDDTQLAAWTLEHLLEREGALDPEALGTTFASRRIRGIGGSVKRFIVNKKAGRPWPACGAPSAGNGALMRIAPVLIPHLREPTPTLWADAALAAMITHLDTASIAACVAYVAVLWELLGRDSPPPRGWVFETWFELARSLELPGQYSPRMGRLRGPVATLSDHVERCRAYAEERGLSTLEGCNAWGSGAYLLETMPSVLWILDRHLADPEEAIVRAVNDTKDNDTVAAIVGAAVGALHGKRGLPERWVERLPGSTRWDGRDPGRVQGLIEQARGLFWS